MKAAKYLLHAEINLNNPNNMTAEEMLNKFIPNRGMNNDRLTILVMQEYADQEKSKLLQVIDDLDHKLEVAKQQERERIIEMLEGIDNMKIYYSRFEIIELILQLK